MMISKYENKKIEIKLNTDLRGFRKGQILKIRTDTNGTPTDRYWRDRFRESNRDGCIEKVVKQKKAKAKENK